MPSSSPPKCESHFSSFLLSCHFRIQTYGTYCPTSHFYYYYVEEKPQLASPNCQSSFIRFFTDREKLQLWLFYLFLNHGLAKSESFWGVIMGVYGVGSRIWLLELKMKQVLSVQLCFFTWVLVNGFACCRRPTEVNIGAVFSFDTVIGRASKPAMEAAVSDINQDPEVLNGTKLQLITADANCSVFLGAVDAFQVIEKRAVAIIGPQSSGIAHMISSVANGLQVPLVSYAATDPTLSALQFPFFIRTTQSDSYQMAAIADLVDFYGWKQVIAVFVDDDYGRNGVSSLGYELDKKMAKISYKLALPVEFDESNLTVLLKNSKLIGPRVYIVHVNPDPQLKIFRVAQKLQMLSNGYVWIATDWLSATLDSISPIKQDSLNFIQGVVGLRQHMPKSTQLSTFLSRWKKMQLKGLATSELNTYGIQAYDTVWIVALAIDRLINEFDNITFSSSDKLPDNDTSNLELGKLKVFGEGNHLRQNILQTNYTGLTGRVQFDEDQNVLSNGLDVINIDQSSIRTVGYWANTSGFSLIPPEIRKEAQDVYSRTDQKLKYVTWPGGKTQKPRGWVIADNERPLRIGVPHRTGFVDFVTEEHKSHEIKGYCIDVFLEARKLVPYDVPYKFVPVGDGRSNPNYDQLVKSVADDVFDAAVGDIAIVTNRTKMADFSQPYAASGLVIVAPVRNSKPNAWVFLKPFTVELWCVTAASFVVIGVVIWILEHRVNDDFRGPPRRQLITVFMFSFSTLFKTNQETTISPLGRMVMVVWLFLLMVITASYTASLTSILTIQQLSSPITGIDSLIASNWPIGYQVGSFAYSYLSQSLYVTPSRLKPLGSPEEYVRALQQGPANGGVAALVDELPYVELFLKNQSNFGIIGQPFTRGGWGFAFQRGSPLAVDISTAILKLSESGELQKIRERWFCKMGCPEESRRHSEPNKLRIVSFWGLYLLCGVVTLAAFLVFLLRMFRQFVRYKRREMQSSPSAVSSSTHCSQVIYNFFNFIDEKEEAIKKMFTQCENPKPPANAGN